MRLASLSRQRISLKYTSHLFTLNLHFFNCPEVKIISSGKKSFYLRILTDMWW